MWVKVTLGSAVTRTPAASVICGTGVARSVGATVGARVGAGVVATAVARADALGLGLAVGDGVGVEGGVGASVRNGFTVGSASGSSDSRGFSATGGWSGAFAFLGCASAYVVEPSIESPVMTTAARRSAQAGMVKNYAVTAGMRSYRVPSTSDASTFMCDSRISWYTARKSTPYFRFPSRPTPSDGASP